MPPNLSSSEETFLKKILFLTVSFIICMTFHNLSDLVPSWYLFLARKLVIFSTLKCEEKNMLNSSWKARCRRQKSIWARWAEQR